MLLPLRRASLACVEDASVAHLSPTPVPQRATGHRRAAAAAAAAPGPSLLLAPRSALLPVNLPARLWSASDRRAQLVAPCQGCGTPNGDGHVHASASRVTQNGRRRRPQVHVVFSTTERPNNQAVFPPCGRLTRRESELDSPDPWTRARLVTFLAAPLCVRQ